MNTLDRIRERFNKERLGTKELAELLGLDVKTIHNLVSGGRFDIPTYKEGNRRLADIRDVAEYLDRKRDEAREEHARVREQRAA